MTVKGETQKVREVSSRFPSCSCSSCVSCCQHYPGWFLPGEAEKAAKLLGLSWAWFKRRYLWEVPMPHGKPGTILLPQTVVNGWGHMEWSTKGIGRCVFLTDEARCKIHEAKPFECRSMYGPKCKTGNRRPTQVLRRLVLRRWREHWKNRRPKEYDPWGMRKALDRACRTVLQGSDAINQLREAMGKPVKP